MTAPPTISNRPRAGLVDAYCTTGSSPGIAKHLRTRLTLEGGEPADVHVEYELHGAPFLPPVVVLGGISAGKHLSPTATDPSAGWWPGVVGKGLSLDPGARHLVAMDFLGGSGSSLDEQIPVTTVDQANLLATVLDAERIRGATVIGASYGGMVGLALAAHRPDLISSLLVFCAAHRTHPLATGWRHVQREIVRLGLDGGLPRRGLALARALAMTTYRGERELNGRFGHANEPEDPHRLSPVGRYLMKRGESFADRFDPAAYLRLSESVDLHDIDPAAIEVPTTVVSFDSDRLVPPWLVAELADRSPRVRRHVSLSSPYGHDAFLKEVGQVSRVIGQCLAGEESR